MQLQKSRNVVQVSKAILSSRMASSNIIKTFGIISDIQYADAEDATDFSGKQKRFYRNSLIIVKEAAKIWKEKKVQFVVQLGDIIDARAKAHKGSDVECSKVLEELQKSDCQYLVNIIGNHELYNFNREELVKRLGILKNGSSWYSFKPWEDLPLRMVVLDGYDISTIQGLDENKTSEAKTLLKRHNPNDIESFGVEWSKGLQGVNKRFMPYNGMIGDEQMHWFKKTLKESCESNEAVIILSHIPIHPDAADHLCLLWNYNDVLEVIRGHPCTVAVLAGHDHEGGHFLDNGVHHLTLPSPLLCQGDEVAFMTASVNAEHKELNLLWHGDSKIIPKDLKIKL